MDAHSRGRADEIDPADQWVLNPRTGNYELRLDRSAPQQPQTQPQPQQRRPSVAAPRRSSSSPSVRPGAPAAPTAPSPAVPGPRRGDGPPGGRRGRRSRRGGGGGRRKKVLVITGGTLAFLLVAAGVGSYLYYEHLNSNIQVTDVLDAGTGGFKKDQPINILVIGTDKRSGAGNEGYGDKDSVGHADTTILFHVAKDRTNATALSIPRDLITDIPVCPTKVDGKTKDIPGKRGERFNNSLGQEGRDAGCTMRTVKELTGIEVDHFMMADFNAVKTLSTAVGGVPVCLDKDVNDKGGSNLKLSKGEHRLQGEEALAFVRTRHAFGNQSDLDRIKIQQQFLGSMMREMKSKETLTSPKKFFSLAEAATKSLAVDSGIGDIGKLTKLAGELKDIDPKNVTFTTLPVVDNPAEKVKATVVLHPTQAEPLLQMIRGDVSLTEVEKKEEAAKAAADAEAQAKLDALLQGPRAAAADVRVDVYNGGGPKGAAGNTLTWLQTTKGVPRASNLGNAPVKVGATQLEYAPNQADQARALADMMGLPATALKMGTADAAPKTPMKLTLGPDFQGPGAALGAPVPQQAPEGIQRVEADKAVCAK